MRSRSGAQVFAFFLVVLLLRGYAQVRKEQRISERLRLARIRALNSTSSSVDLQGHRSIELVEPLVRYGDSIYLKGDWDGAPVVLDNFKLIFFTSAKVGCTTWKQLFRRMMGHSNWSIEEYEQMIPWNPELNGLKYLYDYDRETASDMMTSPEWTRAIFVRDPKERFISAYIDKALHNPTYLQDKCCAYTGSCLKQAKDSVGGFLHLVYFCSDAHWRPQHNRMEEKYWPYINFVGHMETLQEDAETLLKQVGAWKEYGSTGWGVKGDQYVFQAKAGDAGRLHATSAKTQLQSYLTAELEAAVDEYYAEDYSNAAMNLTMLKVFD